MERARVLLARWRADYNFKTLFNSGCSLLISAGFALVNGFLGVRSQSLWHGSICVYYLLLAVIRISILWTERRLTSMDEEAARPAARRTFRITSAVLLVLNLALVTPVSLMVLMLRPVTMGLIPAITVAAYTVFKITMAAINLKRKNRSGDILVRELRTINFIDAIVSILTLQNTLIAVNGAGSDPTMLRLTSPVSADAMLVILGISIRNPLLPRRMKNRKEQTGH